MFSTSTDRAARYKWVALTNTTLGMLMATVNSSIVIISLPAIFRGIGLELLPADFSYPVFALLLLVNGVGSGLFMAPNTAGIMNSVPAAQRGVGSGMRATFQNSGFVLSIGLFFSLMIAGLASALPHTLQSGLTSNGVPAAVATRVANLPPVGSLFAAFLGYNPIQTLLGPQVLGSLPPGRAAFLTGQRYFPQLISGPFAHGLRIVFTAAALLCLVAALASWLRGGRYVHGEGDQAAETADKAVPSHTEESMSA